MQHTIAIVFDFDETLAPDSTSGFLEDFGLDVPAFWKHHAQLVKKGWDPIPAYLQMMIEKSRKRPPGERVTRERLQSWGKRIKPYPGTARVFSRIRNQVRAVSEALAVEFFIISSGIGEVVRASPLAAHCADIWASDFSFNHKDEIDGIKNVVSFTDKTRFLFQIKKGLFGAKARGNPFLVNERVPKETLHVPFKQMIVIGDGFTDVPCFSLVQKNGGIAIGVYDRQSKDRWGKAWGFIEHKRVTHMVAADYTKNSGLDDALSLAVDKICREIVLRGLTFRG